MIRRSISRSASPGVGTTLSEDKAPGPTSPQALLNTGSPSAPTGSRPVPTGSPDTTTTTTSPRPAPAGTQNPYLQTTQSSSPPSLPTSRSTLSSLGASPLLPLLRTSGQVPSTSISETFTSLFDIPSSCVSDGTLTTYNGSGTITREPKFPSLSSHSSMSAGNGGQTNISSPGGETNNPSPTGGGTPPQNSPPASGPTISDVGPSPTVPSGVSPSPPSNSKGSGPGSGDTSVELPTSVPTQLPAPPSVTSILPTVPTGQPTPSQLPSLTTSPTSGNSNPTTSSSSSPSTSSSNKVGGPSQQPVPTSSDASPGPPTPTDPATFTSQSSNSKGPPQTTTSAPTSTSSSQEGFIPSVLSGILSPSNTHDNPSKSSTTTSDSSSNPTDPATSTSKSSNPQTTTSAPPLTSSSQEGFIPSVLSGILSPSKTHNNPVESSTTTSDSSSSLTDPTTSTSKSSKHSGPQTTTSAPPSTSSSQEGFISSVLSSILSSVETHINPGPTDSTTSTSKSSKHSDPQTTTSEPTTTSSFQDGSITSDKTHNPSKSPSTTSSSFTGDTGTSYVEAPSPSPTSGDSSPPTTTQTDKAHTPKTTTSNSPAPGPTENPELSSTKSMTLDSPTTVPGTKTPESPNGGLEDGPSPTADHVTTVTDSSGGLSTVLLVQPSDNSADPHSPQGTTPVSITFVGTGGTATSVIQTSAPFHNTGTPNNLPVSTPMTGSKTLTFTSESTYTALVTSGTMVYMTTITTSYTVTQTIAPKLDARSNEGAIVGGIVGGILALLVLSIAACYFIRRRRRSRYHQQLQDDDLTAPLSPATAEAMREAHPYRPTYDIIGGESQDDIHHASSSFVSSAFALPHLAAAPGSPQSHARTSSGSAFYENVSVSNDGYASSGEGSESTERDFASAQSLYTSDDWQSSASVGVGIAIGSELSMDLRSYRTAATRLAPAIQTHLDDDEELESPGPSPSSFPTPPSSISRNPFLNTARIVDYPELVASHSDAVLTLSEAVALAPMPIFTEKQTSWVAAVAAASPTDAQTPKATRSLNPFTDAGYVVDVSSDSSSEDIKMPMRSGPLLTPSNNSSFVVNPFLRQASQEGFSDDSRSTESHETVTIPYAYSDPSRDKGKGKARLSADLMDDTKRNRLSNASSGLEFPENPSQCGIAL